MLTTTKYIIEEKERESCIGALKITHEEANRTIDHDNDY